MNRAFSPSACLCCLAAGLWLALPQQGYSATVLTGINQFGTTANLGYVFINDDIGATYNSASLDLSSILGTVVDAIVANNPLFATSAQVYGAMAMNITNTGDVYDDWTTSIDPNTGLLSITNFRLPDPAMRILGFLMMIRKILWRSEWQEIGQTSHNPCPGRDKDCGMFEKCVPRYFPTGSGSLLRQAKPGK